VRDHKKSVSSSTAARLIYVTISWADPNGVTPLHLVYVPCCKTSQSLGQWFSRAGPVVGLCLS